MTEQEKFRELISAAADGEISGSEQARLDAWLAENPDGRALAEQFDALGRALDDVDPLEPPDALRQSILEQVEKGGMPASSGFVERFSGLFGMHFMRYAGTFGAGVLLTLALTATDTVSRIGAGDTNRLVGTIGALKQDDSATHSAIDADGNRFATTVELRERGTLAVLEIESESAGTVDFAANYDNDELHFLGFEQTPGAEADLLSRPGHLALKMTGQQHYVLYLDRAGQGPATIRVGFSADGKTILEKQLPLEGE